MIRILNQDFAKEVKRELRKKSNGFNKVVVNYYIDNENKNGTLNITIWNSTEVVKEMETQIEFDWRIVSIGLRDGNPVRRIVFSLNPTDTIIDIITHDHYVECYKNAYGWDFSIREYKNDKVSFSRPYHISMIHFYNATRNKSSRLTESCFDGFEIIYTDKLGRRM